MVFILSVWFINQLVPYFSVSFILGINIFFPFLLRFSCSDILWLMLTTYVQICLKILAEDSASCLIHMLQKYLAISVYIFHNNVIILDSPESNLSPFPVSGKNI